MKEKKGSKKIEKKMSDKWAVLGYAAVALMVFILVDLLFINIINLVYEFEDLSIENADLKTKIVDTSDCEFIRTYNVRKIMDDYALDDSSKVVLLLDMYQVNIPVIAIVDRNEIQYIEEGKSYEFSIRNTVYNSKSYETVFKDAEVLKIQETDKVGLDQINEDCSS